MMFLIRSLVFLATLLASSIAPAQVVVPFYNGTYLLETSLDLSTTPAPSVAAALEAFDELIDDDVLTGDPIAESYGLDPAAYLMDFVYRQFCCWEALGPGADWDSCKSQVTTHPSGDLSQLYLESFLFWSGAQPRFSGACSGLEFANESTQQEAQSLVTAWTPTVTTSLPQLATDLADVFSTLRLESTLDTSDLAAGGSGPVTHTLTHLVADLHDLDGNPISVSLDLVDAGLTNLASSGTATADLAGELTLPSESFDVDFGRLLQQLWLLEVLPAHQCDPDHDAVTEPCQSTEDLFSTWIDCGPIGVNLADETGTGVSAGTFESFCELGIAHGAAQFDAELAAMFSSQTVLTLGGTATPSLLDGTDRVVEVSGMWDGTLSEDAVALGAADGTFVPEPALVPSLAAGFALLGLLARRR